MSFMDDTYYNDEPVKGKAMSKVGISVEKTFTFTEENIRSILADYLAREHSINIDPDSFIIKVSDSTTSGWNDSTYVPAKLDQISVKVPVK